MAGKAWVTLSMITACLHAIVFLCLHECVKAQSGTAVCASSRVKGAALIVLVLDDYLNCVPAQLRAYTIALKHNCMIGPVFCPS